MDNNNNGKANGGIARAKILTREERVEIAKYAAQKRWGFKATHKGNFKDDFGIDVECYVLDDENKTAVISKRGMASALKLSDSGSSLLRFVGGKIISEAVGAELLEKIHNPLIFQSPSVGLNLEQNRPIHGYNVEILIDICKAVVKAESDNKLLKSQSNIAKQAHIILNASAKLGIKWLVYALSGYDATREEVIKAFKFYVQEEAREYEKEFPNELYRQWYRLYQIPKPIRNKPWKFKHLTINQVYKPLAKSSGKILELAKLMRSEKNEKYKRIHQFLSIIGVKALRQHLGQLLGIAQVSNDSNEYEKHVNKIFGDQQELDF